MLSFSFAAVVFRVFRLLLLDRLAQQADVDWLLCEDHLKRWDKIFGSSSYFNGKCPTNFFPSRVPLTVLQFEFLPANQKPTPICCWYIAIFNPGDFCYPNLDLITPPLSLCLCDCLKPLSHTCPSFSTLRQLTSISSIETTFH